MQLSSTSYALLGLLSLRRWTTYELTQQAQRSLRYLYPRAERHLYAEAKRLAVDGLARTEVTFNGKRRSTTYAITPAGRRALKTWLRTQPEPPVLEAEVLLRSFFAELGDKDDLLASLAAARAQARAAQEDLAALAEARLAGDAPFPERTPVIVLSMRFVTDFHRLLEEWADWAIETVNEWETSDGAGWDDMRSVMSDIALGPSEDGEPAPGRGRRS